MHMRLVHQFGRVEPAAPFGECQRLPLESHLHPLNLTLHQSKSRNEFCPKYSHSLASSQYFQVRGGGVFGGREEAVRMKTQTSSEDERDLGENRSKWIVCIFHYAQLVPHSKRLASLSNQQGRRRIQREQHPNEPRAA